MDRPDALVIGAGPAGLMAAQQLAQTGHNVTVAEAMPTPARKFLMAGKSGLNLTKAEPPTDFAARIATPTTPPDAGPHLTRHDLRMMVQGFGPDQVTSWAKDLGTTLFTGSTGRVFPVGMKASPLLRAWLARLGEHGVALRTRWRWQGLQNGKWAFSTPDGPRYVMAKTVILAMGGASWPRLGSDASWVPYLQGHGIEIAPFRPANMGFCVNWTPAMTRFFGKAVKGTALHAGDLTSRGEWVIARHGIEGGGIYEIASTLRDGMPGCVDLTPDIDLKTLTNRLTRPRGKLSIGNWLRRVLSDPVKAALVLEWGQPLPRDPAQLAACIKSLPIRHDGPTGLDRAISSAGGIRLTALTPDLELTALPGVFAAGEMLDWEAPTGGYLLTTCLATGRHAGRAAARLLQG